MGNFITSTGVAKGVWSRCAIVTMCHECVDLCVCVRLEAFSADVLGPAEPFAHAEAVAKGKSKDEDLTGDQVALYTATPTYVSVLCVLYGCKGSKGCGKCLSGA